MTWSEIEEFDSMGYVKMAELLKQDGWVVIAVTPYHTQGASGETDSFLYALGKVVEDE